MSMTDERFNELVNGPLRGPLPQFTLTRILLALRHVVSATGDHGERALEEYCHAREMKDRGNDAPELE